MSRRNGVSRGPGEEDDICPVCKSSRYLNPNMRFLVNPECYHKMCESCVDRIFSQGPAPCPVAGCGRTLRKQRFRKQTFGDIHIEREVDIRRRVAQVFNRRQEEFTSLLAYNNYLEEVETLTFNLLHRIDLPATESALASHAAQNAPSISHNASLQTQESASLSARQAFEKEQARLRREAARKEEDDERRELEEGKREILNRLATRPGDPDAIAREGQTVILKKSTARRSAAEKARQQQQQQASDPFGSADNGASGFTIKGLKPTVVAEPEKPYDPFGGVREKRDYYVLQDYYEHPWLDNARTDPQITAGGYDVHEYYARTMLEAFAGLGCFIEAEVAGRDVPADKSEATAAAAAASGGGGGHGVGPGGDVL
ncbi:MAG: CDK-activating kinase assembly factor MAT1 [Lasallia pustulata]|uniref:RNA polymerase II transcription factor B subunit 3 n=1 Tax=Lasallia pustulata TaxID=136370 RepID=A0A5M8PDJ6_9LECA|nr:MAG: CDK-activating kinase assembly factor MAT1 [Lasallia pustulata]